MGYYPRGGRLVLVERALRAGLGIRETARLCDTAKETVAKAHRLLVAEHGPFLCGCGRPSIHRGSCSVRFRKSAHRQALLARLHERQRTLSHARRTRWGRLFRTRTPDEKVQMRKWREHDANAREPRKRSGHTWRHMETQRRKVPGDYGAFRSPLTQSHEDACLARLDLLAAVRRLPLDEQKVVEAWARGEFVGTADRDRALDHLEVLFNGDENLPLSVASAAAELAMPDIDACSHPRTRLMNFGASWREARVVTHRDQWVTQCMSCHAEWSVEGECWEAPAAILVADAEVFAAIGTGARFLSTEDILLISRLATPRLRRQEASA